MSIAPASHIQHEKPLVECLICQLEHRLVEKLSHPFTDKLGNTAGYHAVCMECFSKFATTTCWAQPFVDCPLRCGKQLMIRDEIVSPRISFNLVRGRSPIFILLRAAVGTASLFGAIIPTVKVCLLAQWILSKGPTYETSKDLLLYALNAYLLMMAFTYVTDSNRDSVLNKTLDRISDTIWPKEPEAVSVPQEDIPTAHQLS
jgi:hypothetical protein